MNDSKNTYLLNRLANYVKPTASFDVHFYIETEFQYAVGYNCFAIGHIISYPLIHIARYICLN